MNRRALLKAMSGLAAGSYFSGLFQSAWAQSATPLRLIVVSSAHGYAPQFWRPRLPSGQPGESGWSVTFDPDATLAPLDAHKDSMLVLEGLDLSVLYRSGASGLTGHAGGAIAPLTGSDARGPDDRRAKSASLDVALASLFQQRPLLFRQSGYAGAANGVSYDSTGEPLANLYDVRDVYAQWFASQTLPPTDTGAQTRRQAARLKVLSTIRGDAARLRTRLPASELPKLDAHLASLSLIEQQLNQPVTTGCVAPTKPAAPVYDPGCGCYANDPVAEMGTLMNLVVTAMSCGLTRVATICLDPGTYLPGVDLGGATRQIHNDVAHSYRPADEQSARYLSRVGQWYARRIADLCARLKAVPEGGKTMYDNTIILWVNELGDPAEHLVSNMPFVVLGGGGAFRRGRYLNFAGEAPHNRLLVSVANQFGANLRSFGEPDVTGELPGLL
jgi:Protein of unknown function (DUF1552)